MIDVGTQIRKAYYDVLNTAVIINAGQVPIVDEKLDGQFSEQDIYMLIDSQKETPSDNKTKYANEIDLTIRVVNRRKATNSKTVVEDVSNQMLGLLFPVKNSNALTVAAPLSLTYARLIASEYQFEKTDDGWQIMKVLIFRNRITQQ